MIENAIRNINFGERKIFRMGQDLYKIVKEHKCSSIYSVVNLNDENECFRLTKSTVKELIMNYTIDEECIKYIRENNIKDVKEMKNIIHRAYMEVRTLGGIF